MSFGDYCYFKENPVNIDLSVCDTDETIENYIEAFNKTQDPYKILNWIINYEITAIYNEIYKIELDINRAKNIYNLLGIIKKHYNITEDIILKIFRHIEEDISI
jgi:endonuclease III